MSFFCNSVVSTRNSFSIIVSDACISYSLKICSFIVPTCSLFDRSHQSPAGSNFNAAGPFHFNPIRYGLSFSFPTSSLFDRSQQWPTGGSINSVRFISTLTTYLLFNAFVNASQSLFILNFAHPSVGTDHSQAPTSAISNRSTTITEARNSSRPFSSDFEFESTHSHHSELFYIYDHSP